MENLNGAEEDTIILCVEPSLLLVLFGPLATFVSPWSFVSLHAPWIPYSNKSLTIAEHDCVNEGVGMTANNAITAATEASHRDHCSLLVLFDKDVPKLLYGDVLALDHHTWCTSNCIQSFLWVSTDESFVAAMVLRERFLVERAPHGFVPTDIGEECSVLAFLHWKSIVNG